MMEEPTRHPVSMPVERSLNPGGELTAKNEYLRLSKSLTYSYLFILPILLIYEVGILLTTGGEIRIGADIWIKQILSLVGLNDTLLLSLLLLIGGAAIFFYERKKGIPIRTRHFGVMFLESTVYAVISGFLVSNLVAQLFSLRWPPALQIPGGRNIGRELVLSLGAGVYEEFFFRLLLVSALTGILWLIARALSGKGIVISQRTQYIVAAIIGALIFSWVHYVGAFGDPFTLSSFTFRFMMGLLLNAIFILRGFGIAAMTHALYDVFVTVT